MPEEPGSTGGEAHQCQGVSDSEKHFFHRGAPNREAVLPPFPCRLDHERLPTVCARPTQGSSGGPSFRLASAWWLAGTSWLPDRPTAPPSRHRAIPLPLHLVAYSSASGPALGRACSRESPGSRVVSQSLCASVWRDSPSSPPRSHVPRKS